MIRPYRGNWLVERSVSMDCVFCMIANGDIETDIVYEDDEVIFFNDTNPQAPIHILAIPKEHIPSANQVNEENSALIGRIFHRISQVAEREGFAVDGYRIVNNCGSQGGQTVDHIHYHVLAGRNLQWPPG